MGTPSPEPPPGNFDRADRRGAWRNQWRLCCLMRPLKRGASAETSPLLIYVAGVLAFLFVVLESDAHQVELESLGILTNNYPVPAALLGL
jgi:hypothetical protein